MKSRKSLIQRCLFEVNERRQAVADIESMMGECQKNIVDLERQIEFEQERSGVDDVNHFAYPTFAKAAIQRRDNLKNSVRELESRLEEARDHWVEACEALQKNEIEERDAECFRTKSAAREHMYLNEIGIM